MATVTKKIDTLPAMELTVANNDKLVMLDVDQSAENMTKLMTMSQIPISLPAQLAGSVVENAAIANNAVYTDKILNGGVPLAKLEKSLNAYVVGNAASNATTPDSPVEIVPGGTNQVLTGSTGTTNTVGFGKVTVSHMDNIAARTVLGNATNATAAPTAISAGTTNGLLLVSNGSTLAWGRAVADSLGANSVTNAKLDSATAGSEAVSTTKIQPNAVTNAKIRKGAARSVIGNASAASADVADIASGGDGYVLRQVGDNTTGTIGFGKVKAAGIDSMTSAELAAIVSNETGSGALVFGTSPTIGTATLNSPTLVTPALGTPTSGVLTNCTGLKHVVYMQLFLPDEAIVGSATARTQFFVPSYLAGGVVKQLGIGIVASSTGKTVGVALGSTYGSVSGVTSTETAGTLSYTLPSALTKIPITVSCTTGDPAPKGLDFWFVVLK